MTFGNRAFVISKDYGSEKHDVTRTKGLVNAPPVKWAGTHEFVAFALSKRGLTVYFLTSLSSTPKEWCIPIEYVEWTEDGILPERSAIKPFKHKNLLNVGDLIWSKGNISYSPYKIVGQDRKCIKVSTTKCINSDEHEMESDIILMVYRPTDFHQRAENNQALEQYNKLSKELKAEKSKNLAYKTGLEELLKKLRKTTSFWRQQMILAHKDTDFWIGKNHDLKKEFAKTKEHETNTLVNLSYTKRELGDAKTYASRLKTRVAELELLLEQPTAEVTLANIKLDMIRTTANHMADLSRQKNQTIETIVRHIFGVIAILSFLTFFSALIYLSI